MRLAQHFALLPLVVTSVFAADDARIKELEGKLEELDRKYRALEQRLGSDQAKSPSPAIMSIGAQGFTYNSADTNFVLKIKGLIQGDSRFFLEDGGNNRNDTF